LSAFSYVDVAKRAPKTNDLVRPKLIHAASHSPAYFLRLLAVGVF